jgi:hypothetical protein
MKLAVAYGVRHETIRPIIQRAQPPESPPVVAAD